MKILVTGVKGQLGYDVMQVLHQRDAACLGADIEDFDITDAAGYRRFYRTLCPGRCDSLFGLYGGGPCRRGSGVM